MRFAKVTLALALLVAGVQTEAKQVNVGNVTWQKSADSVSGEFDALTYSDSAGGMVFIRPASNNQRAAKSSTNIAIDNRFLVSIQDGHYTSSGVCAGNVQLSAVATGMEINDLSADPILVSVAPRQIQYFVVETSQNFTPRLRQVDETTAKGLLANTKRQAHQISRVDIHNCPQPIALTPMTTPPPVFEQPTYQEMPTLRLNIQFDHDKSVIKPEFAPEIARAAAFLAQYPDMDAVLEGHTDSTGTDKYNQALSKRRAEAVKQALIKKHGVSARRLQAVGYGESRPVATNSTKAGRYENRRVMVVIPSSSR